MRVNIHSSDCAQLRTNNFVFAPVRGRNRAKSFELVQHERGYIATGMQRVQSVPTLIMNEVSFAAWIAQADAGDILKYHRGFLVIDTDKARTPLDEADRVRLLALARRAMQAAEIGLVHLVQRRHGDGDYSYLAIARSRPKKLPASIAQLLFEEAA